MSEHAGRGTVWLAFHGATEPPSWWGYWDLEPDGPPTMLEQGPGWSSADGAIRWGRARASQVWIRMDDVSDFVWAGEGEQPG